MKNFFIRLLVTAVAVIFAVYMLDPHVKLKGGFVEAFLLACVLGFLNAVLKPLLVLLTLPITVLTLGIFYFFLNAFIIYIATYIDDNFKVESLWWAFLFSVIVSIITAIIETVLRRDKILTVDQSEKEEV
ncbi:MAG: phage holin family protein [Bacteroidota bacterium]|nr:phage holin family protein [Bacteroidota bacterium]